MARIHLDEMIEVTFRGKKRLHAPPLETVRREILAYLGGEPGEEKVVDQTELRRQRPSLYYWVGVHGLLLSQDAGVQKPTRDAGLALEKMGFSTRRWLPETQLMEMMRVVITGSMARDTYQGNLTAPVAIKKLFWDHSPRARQAYSACFNSKRSGHKPGTFKRLVDSLYPDLTREFDGESLYSALRMEFRRSPEEVTAQCREWFYAGEDLSVEGITHLHPHGKRVAYRISGRATPGTLHFGRRRTHQKGERGKGLYVHKLCTYLNVEGLTPTELVPTQGAQKMISLIAERELFFLLQIALRHDPTLRKMGTEFREYFPGPLQEIHPPHEREALRVKNGERAIEADGRIIAGGLEILVEVKGHRHLVRKDILKMCTKYDTATAWEDGTPIDRKVALLNCSNGDLSQSKEILQEDNWKVMDAKQFTTFYQRALCLLMENEPDFWRTAAIPLTSVEVLLQMHELVSQHSHLLGRRSQSFAREWLANLLKENANSLATGRRVAPREVYTSVYVEPFSKQRDTYGDRIDISVEDCLFFDLETAGFRNQGAPIFVLGMAYKQGRGMVTDLYLVRDPTEEKEALLRFEKEARKHKKLISFNGAAFDEGFLRERFIANLLPYTVQAGSVDLYPAFRDFAQRHHFPRATLQTYEGTQLGFRRHDDVPGSKIPQIYRDFVYGRDDTLVPAVLRHNQMDLITMVLMYEQFYGKRK